jgi:hypothetical protein
VLIVVHVRRHCSGGDVLIVVHMCRHTVGSRMAVESWRP